MKKTHWLRNTLIVLIICGLAGTILAAVLFGAEGGRTSASAFIQFSYNGADEGKAPNGYRFDMTGLSSDEVLEAALEAAGLTGTYTAEQLRENLVVTGMYPEGIAEKMTQYVSLMDTEADTEAALTDYHATQYSVVLYNDFDKGIASGKLTELLNAILSAYRSYFAGNYAAGLDTTEPIAELSAYDYAQQLEAIGESVDQQIRYAQELEKMAPDFMVNGKDFGDIEVRFSSLKGDIDRLNATVTLNAVSKDRKRLQKRYEMEIRSLKNQQESLTEELKLIEKQVGNYEKDGVIYVSSGGRVGVVEQNEINTYDKLVENRKNVADRIAEVSAKITLYQARLDDMTGAISKASVEADEETDAAAAEQLSAAELKALRETVEQKIETLTAKKDVIVSDFAAMLKAYTEREVNEKTVSVTAVRYDAPSLVSGEFVLKMIETAGPFCAVGFMVCLVLLIISRRKEEKAKAKA